MSHGFTCNCLLSLSLSSSSSFHTYLRWKWDERRTCQVFSASNTRVAKKERNHCESFSSFFAITMRTEGGFFLLLQPC